MAYEISRRESVCERENEWSTMKHRRERERERERERKKEKERIIECDGHTQEVAPESS